MEHYNISKLLNDSTVKNLLQNKWVEVNDLSSAQRSVHKNIRFKILVLRSDLYDYSDAYIVVKVAIDFLAAGANENDKAEKDVAFKNKAQFRSCISKINSTFIDNAKDLNIVKIIPWHQEVYGIITEMKMNLSMIMLQMVNHLYKKQK